MSDSNTIFSILGDEDLLNNQYNQAFACADDASEDDGDEGYEDPDMRGDHHTPPPIRQEPHQLSITVNSMPKNPLLGFVVGRDPAVCDIVLDHKRVSERLFCIRPVVEYKTLLLQNLYYYGTRATFYRLPSKGTVKRSRIFLENERIDITLFDNVKITIQRKNDPTDWSKFCANLGRLADASPGSASQGRESARLDTTPKAKEYIKDRSLGKGAFGEVHRVVEKYTGKVYAMKVYNQSEKARWQESAMMDRLRHKHIVRFVEYLYPAGQSPRLIMEYVDGSDLENVLAHQGDSPLVLSEKKVILHQLLEATAHIHKSGVTHRDIKPANIMVAKRSPIHIVLVDFGLSTGQGQFNTTCGTPLYSAPELLLKTSHANYKVDMYAVGVIALQLMYGFHFSRYDNRDFRSCLGAIREQREDMAARCHGNFVAPFDFIHQLLSHEPTARPSAPECLAHHYFLSPLPGVSGRLYFHELPAAVHRAAGEARCPPVYSTMDARSGDLARQSHADPGRSTSHLQSPIVNRRRPPTSLLLPPPKRSRLDVPGSRLDQPRDNLSFERSSFFLNSEAFKTHYPPPPLATVDKTAAGSNIQLPSLFSSGSHRSTHHQSHSLQNCGSMSHDSTTQTTGSTGTSRPGVETGGPHSQQAQQAQQAAPAASIMSIKSISSPTASGGYSESGSHMDMLSSRCWLDPMHAMGGGSLLQLVEHHRPQAPGRGHADLLAPPDQSFIIQPMSYTTSKELAPAVQEEPSGSGMTLPAIKATANRPDFDSARQVANDVSALEEPASPTQTEETSVRPTVEERSDNIQVVDFARRSPEESETTPFSPATQTPSRKESAAAKRRKATSLGDKEILAREYRLNQKPTKAQFRQIQKSVNMTYKQIRIWFQNRRYQDRAKDKGDTPCGA